MNLQEARSALVALRQRKNLTQTDVANKLNTSQASIARIENANAELTWKQVTRYATALGQKLTVSLESSEPVLKLDLDDIFPPAAGRSFQRLDSCPDYVNITNPEEGRAVQTVISGVVGIGKTYALARIAHLLRDEANILLADPRGEVFSYLQEMESPAAHTLQISRTGRAKNGVAFLGDTALADIASYARQCGHILNESPLPTIALVDDPASSEARGALADTMQDLSDSGYVAGVIGTSTDESRSIPRNGAVVHLGRTNTRECSIDVATDGASFNDLRQYALEFSTGALPPVWLPTARSSSIPRIIDAVSDSDDAEALVLRSGGGASSDPLLEHTPEAVAELVHVDVCRFCDPHGREKAELRAHVQQAVAKATDVADLLKRLQRAAFLSPVGATMASVVGDSARQVARNLARPGFQIQEGAALLANARKIMKQDTGRKTLILDVRAKDADTEIFEDILRTARSYNTLVIVIGDIDGTARYNTRVLATT